MGTLTSKIQFSDGTTHTYSTTRTSGETAAQHKARHLQDIADMGGTVIE